MRPLLAATLILGSSCGDTTSPLGGELFALQSIAGASLPAYEVTYVAPGPRILADTIALGTTSGVRRTVRVEPDGSRRTEDIEFTYTKSGDAISISYLCRDDVGDCIPVPTLSGSVTDNGMTISTSQISMTPLVYLRVGFPE